MKHFIDPHSALTFTPRASRAQEDEDMDSRISPDGMLLQAQLSTDETMTIRQIALVVFGEAGQQHPTPVQMIRARAAARNLVNMGGAKPYPNRREIESITSISSPGTQTAAVMNLMIRKHREIENVRAIRESQETIIAPAATVMPHILVVDDVLEEQKARVSASKFPSVHATM